MSEHPDRRHRAVPLLIKCLCVCLMPFIALKILGMGYLPYDDALRHVAKAINGKPWTEILVLNPQFGLDHNFGWHVILTLLHKAMGWQQEALIAFSVTFLFTVFAILPVFRLKRGEAWLAALLVTLIANQGLATRFFTGRPYVLSMAVLMLICFLWLQMKDNGLRPPLLWGITVAAITLAVWAHGVWYLFVLPVMALVLASWWRNAMALAGCWLAGSFLGGLLTGHPVGYLLQAVQIAGQAFGQHTVQRVLAGEFQPSDGVFTFVMMIVLAIFARKLVTGQWPSIFGNPLFLLVVLCWLFGLKVGRFWSDWGVPATMVWLALNFETILEELLPADSFRNLALSAFLGMAIYANMINDVGSRWTLHLNSVFLDASKPEIKELMPADGGIIYSPDMTVFYQTFYQNPSAGWRYALGFEPALMPPEDLNVFRSYQWNYGDTRALEPWIRKMRPEDRMILRGGSATAAPPGLVWREGTPGLWIGRLPAAPVKTNAPAAGNQ
ncbi:MAG TPA: hypothetical protein VGH19_12090 [Verrucomicrobiae bacterium]